MPIKKLGRLTAAISVISLLLLTGQSCTIFSSNSKSDGGIFRSDDRGISWQQRSFIGKVKNKNLTIGQTDLGVLVFHPTDNQTIFIGTRGKGIYRTEDKGERWQVVSGRQTGTVIAIAIDPALPQILYAGNVGHIEKTSDGGVTWQKVYTESRPGVIITSLFIDPTDAKHIYATNSAGVLLESLDRGQSWKINHVFSDGLRKITAHPENPSRLFVIHYKKAISRSDDQGVNWVSLSKSLEGFTGAASTIQGLDFDPRNPSVLYLATQYGLLKTTDAGDNWQAVKTLIPNRTLQIRSVKVGQDNSSYLYFTTENKIHLSRDGGANWEVATLQTGRAIHSLSINPTDPSIIYAGTITIKK